MGIPVYFLVYLLNPSSWWYNMLCRLLYQEWL